MLKEQKVETLHCDICQEVRSYSVCDRCQKDVCVNCCTKFSVDPFPIIPSIVFCKPCQLHMEIEAPELMKALHDVVKLRNDHREYLHVLSVDAKEKSRTAQYLLEKYKSGTSKI